MAGGIYEEPLEVRIGTVEAILPSAASYPYPALQLGEGVSLHTFESVVLENDFLRVVVVPSLGGRIWSIFDKRTQSEFLGEAQLQEGGKRGVVWERGIRFALQGEERATDLGDVSYSIVEGENGRPDELWLAEAANGSNLSWHLKLWLEPETACLFIEGRVLARSMKSIAYQPGFLFWPRSGSFYCTWSEGWRFRQARHLAPHQLDTFTVQIAPYTGFDATHMSPHLAIRLGDEKLLLFSSERILDGKLVLLTDQGPVEAKLSLHPEKQEEIDLAPLGRIREAALLDAQGITLISSMTEKDLSEPDDNSPIDLYGKSMDELRSLLFSTASRHAAHFGLGIRYLDAGDFELADHHFDQSLLYNGEDSIAWCIRAAIERLRGESAEESQFLLNAHFLAPLDPLLRAEGLLRQPQPHSALIQPIASRHGDLIQVACDLIECRLYQDAAKWIEACISIEDVPMLRILRAFVVLKHAGLEFECLDDLARAAAKPLAPPYPWRQIEKEAIAELLNRFPDHERLAQLAELLP